MKVAWFSAGVSSFISTYLVKDSVDKILYTHIDDQHPDTLRFLHDCELALQKEIEILQSDYKSVDRVQQQFRYINGPYGAKCTNILKIRVREAWESNMIHNNNIQKSDITYIWGFDLSERHRADRIQETLSDFNHEFPLIDNQLTKEDAHGMLRELNIKRPLMYDLGYRNNNCIGCVKGGMGYWNRIRIDFPKIFELRAKREREVGHTCLKDVNGPIYLDELDPGRGRLEEEIMEECGILCQIKLLE